MRTPLGSLALTPHNLAHACQWARTAGELAALAPLAQARWLAGVSAAACQAVQAGAAELTLLLDTDSPDCAGPCLAAQIAVPPAQAGAFGDAPAPGETPPALARAGALVDHLGLRPADDGGALLTLEIGLPGSPAAPDDATVRGWREALLRRPAPTPLEALMRQNEDTLGLLEALEASRVAGDRERRGQAEALSRVAHDLRSPLLTLNLCLEMLRMKPHSTDELAQRREVMKRQTEQLRAIAQDLTQRALTALP